MLKEKTRWRMFIGLGILLGLVLILQGAALIASGGMISMNHYGQPLTAVGSILVGLVILVLLPFAVRLRENDGRSRDR